MERKPLDVKVGEEVVVSNVNFGIRYTRVTKVGPKNIFVLGDSSPFDRRTGRIKDKYGHSIILTVAKYHESLLAGSAREEIQSLGLMFNHARPMPTELLFRIHEALKPIICEVKKS